MRHRNVRQVRDEEVGEEDAVQQDLEKYNQILWRSHDWHQNVPFGQWRHGQESMIRERHQRQGVAARRSKPSGMLWHFGQSSDGGQRTCPEDAEHQLQHGLSVNEVSSTDGGKRWTVFSKIKAIREANSPNCNTNKGEWNTGAEGHQQRRRSWKNIKRERGAEWGMENTTMQWRRVILVKWFQAMVCEPHTQEVQIPQDKPQTEATKNKITGGRTRGKPEVFNSDEGRGQIIWREIKSQLIK